MIVFLRSVYALIFVFMLALTFWCATQENILAIPPVVLNDVWFRATLFDAYFAFLSFYLWVCYREKSLPFKVFMFFAITFLGNLAMSIYVLLALYRLKPGEGVEKLFSRQ
ncbi:DUF1475 domain-containing protein [bacterium]|nr:DUF1475 domain-containing protein [bacterium]MBP9808166.1 DUF1475 domain-containing protein [bacterium]